jgi:DnaK suppressor protein
MVTKNIATDKIKSSKSASSGPMGIQPYKLQKDEEYMSESQIQHFDKILNLWKQQLMQEVDRTIYDMQEVANYPDPVDRASQEEAFNLKLRERDRERKLLKKIDEALARIQSGDYGYCDECGAEIGVRRLEARPTATQCIECKTIAEIREKQTGSN